jgi:hypothetical protein
VPSPIIALANLVTDDLNAASLGFTAVRAYLPVLPQDELDSLRVFVIPKAESLEASSRRTSQADRQIDIGLIKKLTVGPDDSFDNAQLDALGDTVQAVKERLQFRPLGNFTWIKTENDPIWVAEHLDQHRQFTSVITVTYRATECSA